ncbi:intraflagellar transport protein 52 homolog isoform X2 [Folsomia candida]|uniref:intraflagellar transport protein 52 homolog isoform X2 n=1 Tax=Folsomia candida TaxID=158441 RepID=UPI0016055B49|nr:intraflagellar transport protein 52 homolog isoform X2 [Folsomia candida]
MSPAIIDGLRSDSSVGGSKMPTELPKYPTESTIIFFASKNETFRPGDNYKTFYKKLKSRVHKIVQLKEELTEDMVAYCKMVIIAGINAPLGDHEVQILKHYVENQGGSVFVLAEASATTHYYNALTQNFGITVVKDCVVRTVYYKYGYPKECLIQSSMICPVLLEAMMGGEEENLTILFPNGCSLNVSKPGLPIISSGATSYPVNRPVGAIYYSPASRGKLIVFGGGHAFSEKYIDKEENLKLLEFCLTTLFNTDHLPLDASDIDDSELTEYNLIPDTVQGAQKVRVCLQESDDFIMPGSANHLGVIEPNRLIDHKLFSLNSNLLPEVLQAYDELGVKKGQLKLIQPQFETPLPPLKVAVFPPSFRELPPPPLELFDLDEEFASEKIRLAQLTNKCGDEDLAFYIQSAGSVLNVVVGDEQKNNPKAILHSILSHLVEFKRSDNNIGFDNASTPPLGSEGSRALHLEF